MLGELRATLRYERGGGGDGCLKGRRGAEAAVSFRPRLLPSPGGRGSAAEPARPAAFSAPPRRRRMGAGHLRRCHRPGPGPPRWGLRRGRRAPGREWGVCAAWPRAWAWAGRAAVASLSPEGGGPAPFGAPAAIRRDRAAGPFPHASLWGFYTSFPLLYFGVWVRGFFFFFHHGGWTGAWSHHLFLGEGSRPPLEALEGSSGHLVPRDDGDGDVAAPQCRCPPAAGAWCARPGRPAGAGAAGGVRAFSRAPR